MDLRVAAVPVSILGRDTRQPAADSCLQDRVARGAVTGSWAYCSGASSGNFMQELKGLRPLQTDRLKEVLCVLAPDDSHTNRIILLSIVIWLFLPLMRLPYTSPLTLGAHKQTLHPFSDTLAHTQARLPGWNKW